MFHNAKQKVTYYNVTHTLASFNFAQFPAFWGHHGERNSLHSHQGYTHIDEKKLTQMHVIFAILMQDQTEFTSYMFYDLRKEALCRIITFLQFSKVKFHNEYNL
jgi:hypothetical protein